MTTDTTLHHRIDGQGPPLVLGPSLGTSLAVWDRQLPGLARDHQVLRWDLPGHGGSAPGLLPADGSATVADLAAHVLRLADARDWARFGYAGISLGGAVGLYLAVHHPHRLTSLTLVCSAARFGEPAAWHQRAAQVREHGTGPLEAPSAKRWFSPSGRPDDRLLTDLRAADPHAYAACCDALATFDLRQALSQVRVDTLVVAGRDDPATPPALARELADGIPGAELTELPHAGHLATVDQPDRVTRALRAHLGAHPPDDAAARHSAGLAVRRAVLGSAHVDRAAAATTPFTAPFQDFITRYAWGEIWTDETLDRRTRSCVTLAALTAHGHLGELGLHVRAALRNGLSPDEIGAVLLQAGVYCGVPAANAAFAVAQQALREAADDDGDGTDEPPTGRN